MDPRQHAVAAVNSMEEAVCQLLQAGMKGGRERAVGAVEREIKLAVEAERERLAGLVEAFRIGAIAREDLPKYIAAYMRVEDSRIHEG
jgi:hypothetical protein